jgi:hypothetical protein
MSSGFFSGLISVSFSAFDPFLPPKDQTDSSARIKYSYVGLKDHTDPSGERLKSIGSLHSEFVASLGICLSEPAKKQRWINAIRTLESDDNFAEMNLTDLATSKSFKEAATRLVRRMSSGHAIVLLTVTKLVSRIEEKTLVLLDEPESHLHPPLLSALVRTLTEILHDRNALAIVATHSPVVLQEVPRSCVWKITRVGLAISTHRPEVETFGENVGLLTSEVFGLEVSKSGFNALLREAAGKFDNYDEAINSFSDHLGFEGRAILLSLFHEKARNS